MSAGWLTIFRLGLVQAALGAIVVLTTSTLNRIMVVELALPAVLPGALVALHYGVQITRPRWGFRSDMTGGRTRWIVAGMAVLALGGCGAALSVGLMAQSVAGGLICAALSFAAIGLGVGASGTSLLALLAGLTAPDRRAAAATITWLMMIFGIAVTAASVGALLDPYSPDRLLKIVIGVTGGAFLVTCLAVRNIESCTHIAPAAETMSFRAGLAEIWDEPRARTFTVFVFLSMTAYFMQELILEPYAGLVFGLTPGQSTSLSGVQNGGVFLGMLAVGILATGLRVGSLRAWVLVGCVGSCAALNALAAVGSLGAGGLLLPSVAALGLFNGIFAVAAIGSMMALAGDGRARREGTRMGLWGAAQAIAAGFGGLLGALLVDLFRLVVVSDYAAFGTVFILESALFLLAAMMALKSVGVRAAPPHAIAGE